MCDGQKLRCTNCVKWTVCTVEMELVVLALLAISILLLVVQASTAHRGMVKRRNGMAVEEAMSLDAFL